MPDPGPVGPGPIRVQVGAVGICGSALHANESTEGDDFMLPHLPVTVDHEFAGCVIATGPDMAIAEGTRFAAHRPVHGP